MRAETLKSRAETLTQSIQRQWRPVIMPALVLWLLASVVSAVFLNPYDIGEYARYAHGALRAPFLHHLPLEYPAPALVVFILPLALPFSYPWAFAVFAGVVLLLLVTSYGSAGLAEMDADAARRLIAYFAVGAVVVLTGRYDIFAVAAAFWSVRAARQDRWSAAWTWSAIGVALKLFPAIFWPAFVIAEWRRNGRPPVRRLAWVAASAVVVAGIPAIFNHSGFLNAVHYYLRRPTEIGSLPSGLSFIVDWHATSLVKSFESVNVINGAARPIAVVLEVAAAASCLWVWRAQMRNRLSLEAACLATLTIGLLGAKVLSAQYLMWLMPLWALYRLRPLWVLAALANVAIFPYEVSSQSITILPGRLFQTFLILMFLARDLLVAWGSWRWLRSELRQTSTPPLEAARAP